MGIAVEIIAKEDGTYTVSQEESQEETAEDQGNPDGQSQSFKSKDEALSAASQILDSASMAPPAPEEQAPAPGDPNAIVSPDDEENNAMLGAYRPR